MSITISRSSLRVTSIESVMPSSHLILCHPLLLPPVPPSIKVFSNESTLRMRFPKYWSFSFSIIPSKEIPGLISFRMDCLDLLAVQGPDILEYEVKWALESITMNKASGGDGIPVELFQILKDDAVKVRTQYANKFGKLRSGHRSENDQFSSQCQKCSNYYTTAFISHGAKQCSEFSKLGSNKST